jgi:hypothetical protein
MSNFVGAARWGKTQSIAYTATPGVIPVGVSAGVTMVRLLTTTDAFVTTDGSVPSATNGTYVVAFTAEYVLVSQGQQPKAVQVAAGGTLYTTERN